MPPKKPIKDKPVLVLFDQPLLSRLDIQAKRYGVSRGAMIRMVVTQYVEDQERPKYPQAVRPSGVMMAAEPQAPYNSKSRS